MTQCVSFDTLIIRDICKIVDQKNQIWSDAVDHTQPRPKCPLKKGTIKVTNATIDLSYIAHFPIEGYTWTLFEKAFKPIANVKHKKQMLFCIVVEATVTKSNRKQIKGNA